MVRSISVLLQTALHGRLSPPQHMAWKLRPPASSVLRAISAAASHRPTTATSPVAKKERLRYAGILGHVQDRQQGLLFSDVPAEYCGNASLFVEAIGPLRIFDKLSAAKDFVFAPQLLTGEYTGQMLLFTNKNVYHPGLPASLANVAIDILDAHDIEVFIERSQRLLTFAEDLRRLASPENFDRVVTIIEVPNTYGRREVRNMIDVASKVKVNLADIVFQFDATGNQTGVVWVACPSATAANRVVSDLQEFPVPIRVQYASLFGCAFTSARKSSCFISHPDLDYCLDRTQAKIYVGPFEQGISYRDVEVGLLEMSIRPTSIRLLGNPCTEAVGALLEFSTMKEMRAALMHLHKLKLDWKLPDTDITFAAARPVHVRARLPKGTNVTLNSSGNVGEDDAWDAEDDDDLEDPIDY